MAQDAVVPLNAEQEKIIGTFKSHLLIIRPPLGLSFDPDLSFEAKDIRKDGVLFRLKGGAEIKFKDKAVLLADEAD